MATLPDELFDWLDQGSQKIAQLEMLMIVHALVKRASEFRGRRAFWFMDNVASLMCLIRGRSDAEDLEKIARFIYIALFALEAIYSLLEHIPSKSNWADPISRRGQRSLAHCARLL